MITLRSGHKINYPIGLSVTLGQWVLFQAAHGADLDKWVEEVQAITHEGMQQLEATQMHVDKCFHLLAFFNDISFEEAASIALVSEATTLYAQHIHPCIYNDDVPRDTYQLFDAIWCVPQSRLTPGCALTFGEFIDGKVISQALQDKQSKWQLIRMLCCIFLRKQDENYVDTMALEGSDRYALMNDVPLWIALQVAKFWEDLNKFCHESFSLFHKSRVKGGKATAKHFERWGWINLLKNIAKTKVFDIHDLGLNSIDCARVAKAVDVLTYASEDKDFGEAQYFDMMAEQEKK